MESTATFPMPKAREILLPKEHGSWSLALEPIALGLIAAWSLPGALLAVGAFAAFLMRRPLQLASEARGDPRAVHARVLVVTLAGIAAVFTAAAGLIAGFNGLLPLLAAIPTGVLFWLFDRKKEARAVEAEIAGAVTFAVLPATIAILASRGHELALVLTAAALARSVPTILTIRAYLRIHKGQPVSRTPAVLAALCGSAVFAILFLNGTAPLVLAILTVLLLGRTILLLAPGFPRLPASRIGMAEAILGLIYAGAAGWALM